MIIQRVEAECLHRYRNLRLADLPERGIIALSGDNESGKSAIGEIVCFALFGRTYALADDRIGKLVHWGAGQGAVTLRFRAKGRSYEVIRHLARDGEQSARLIIHDEAEEPLARGAGPVTAEIERILGHGFDAFVETFYLAEREITTPHPHGPAVRTMVGVTPLQRCAAELGAEVQQEEEDTRRVEERIAALDSELKSLSPDRARVDELEQSLAEIASREQKTSVRLAELESAGDAYCQACRGKGSRALRRTVAGFLSTVTLLATLVVGALWAMLRFQADAWPVPAVRARLEGLLVTTGLPLDQAVVYVGFVLGVLLVLTWIWLLLLSLGTRRRRSRARRLSRELDLVESLEPGPPATAFEGGANLVDDDVPIGAVASIVDKPDAERRSRLQQRILGLDASVEEVRAALAHETAWLRRRRESLGAGRAEGEETLGRARADRLRHRDLTRERSELDGKLSDQRERIATRRLARSLLEGAARGMSDRFSEHLRGMVSRALPQFTEGRYDHLEVDGTLQVRVYSSDKRNLLDLDEISSGTQRQIMLALRLGLSQELVSRVVGDDQFAFLDEAFAFFDSTRMRGALKTLSELGGDVVQYWVVAQRFPQDAHIGLEIACGRHPDTLAVGRPDTD